MGDGKTNEAATQAAVVDEARGEPCPGCHRQLPIRSRKAGELAAHWECSACHTPMTGILLKEVATSRAESLRIGRVHFDTTGVPAVPSRLRQLVNEFVESRRKNHPAEDNRKTSRTPLELDVTISLMDACWTPQAKPLRGIAIDLTPHGLGLITTSEIDAEYAAVEIRLPGGNAQILCRVVWTKDIGHGFFNTGLQFLFRFGRNCVAADTRHDSTAFVPSSGRGELAEVRTPAP